LNNSFSRGSGKRRIVKKYFNGGSDAISVEMRKPIKSQKKKYSVPTTKKSKAENY